MKKVFLGGKYGSIIGNYALVDDADFPRIVEKTWCAHLKKQGSLYAVGSTRKNGKTKTLPMHRFILEPKDKEMVDHINGNGLDNRRKNLRVCTNTSNQWNSKPSIKNKSGYRGVSFNKGKWVSFITVNNRTIYLGRYTSKRSAAKARDEAAKKYRGSFAKLNFPL